MRISDWSSDVCSSDLALGDRKTARKALESLYDRSRKARGERDPTTMDVENTLANLLGRMGEAELGREHMETLVRSEERRVEKEGVSTYSSRCAPSILQTNRYNNLNHIEYIQRC